ncbi:1-phosphofructokinase [Barrientosiimonas marina]|uniref:Tagatose-6-phosphate kinase n=1 Tax=Lentibacillus kimchii TaxID=1542911 RepID=A0ABW2UYM0_9BACI
MIYTITLNPSIDYVVHTPSLELGALNKANTCMTFAGGKGINVSRMLHELSYDTTALGFTGGFTGDFITGELKTAGLATDFTPIQDDSRINIKLKSETETEINAPGPTITAQEADALLHQLDGISDQDTLILSGSTPPSLSHSFRQQLIQRMAQTGAQLVFDTTGEALKTALSFKPLIVKPNQHELAEFFGVTLHNRQDISRCGQKLLDLGARHALVSLGGDGALLLTDNGVYHGSAPTGQVKNSVGSGDSMIAGFTGKWAETGDVTDAFLLSLAAGSATAFSDDLAERGAIEDLTKNITIQRID